MASFAAQQVNRLELLLQENVGVVNVTVDGQTVSYDDLLKQYQFWKSRAARENGTRPRTSQVWLGGYR